MMKGIRYRSLIIPIHSLGAELAGRERNIGKRESGGLKVKEEPIKDGKSLRRILIGLTTIDQVNIRIRMIICTIRRLEKDNEIYRDNK